MNKLFELFVRYINKKSGVWRGVMTALSAVIVFATTYALILPAITLDSGTAYEEPGIEVGEGEIFIEDEFDGYEAEPQETGEPDDAIFFEDEEFLITRLAVEYIPRIFAPSAPLPPIRPATAPVAIAKANSSALSASLFISQSAK